MFGWLIKSLTLQPPKVDSAESIRDFNIAENQAILRQLHKSFPTYSYANRIKEMRGRNAIMRPINGHPDLHEYLWRTVGSDLPLAARWVVCANAAFVHPKSKIIFAMAGGGSMGIQIRICTTELERFPGLLKSAVQAPNAQSVWVLSRFNVSEDRQLLQIAFGFASPSSD